MAVEISQVYALRYVSLWKGEGDSLRWEEIEIFRGREAGKVKSEDEISNLAASLEEGRKRNYKPSEDHLCKERFIKRNLTFFSSNECDLTLGTTGFCASDLGYRKKYSWDIRIDE